MASWGVSDIPGQRDRISLVTGPGGLGYETALALARAGGTIILAGRNPDRGAAAVRNIKSKIPKADLQFELLDLASLASIEGCAERVKASHGRLDLLVNNAGLMMPPKRQVTADGFELQFGTNYLGHFALTGRLLPILLTGNRPRVVSVSSIAHRHGKMDFDDLQSQASYNPSKAYAQSKLAMLIFALELQRRSNAKGWGVVSNAAHPGISNTALFDETAKTSVLAKAFFKWMQPMISQPASDGALPVLLAATAADATGGHYYGPTGTFEIKGRPGPAKIAAQASDETAGTRLWEVSERLTGVEL